MAEKTTAQKIGLALQGFGAGVQGRGPEFLTGLRQQEQDLDDNRKDALLKDAFTIQRMLQSGQISPAREIIMNRLQAIEQLGGDNSDTLGLLNKFDAGDIKGVFNDVSTVVEFAQAQGLLQFPGAADKKFSQKTTGIQTDPVTGQQFTGVFDPNTGTTIRQDIPGAFGETPIQRTTREVGQVQKEEVVRRTAARASEIKAEIGERKRGASRAQVQLRQGLELAKTASQGLTGQGKVFLARLFPNIDVSDEAALDTALTGMAVEILQKFKGQTTDFELNVTRDITGRLGDSKSANIARLKSLDRNNWFIRRESQQFNNWVDQGKRPDDWPGLDLEEKLKTKQGSFTLQQLLVTAARDTMTMPEVLKKLNR